MAHLKIVVYFSGGVAEVRSVRILDTPAVRPPHPISAVGYAAVWGGTVWVETVPDPFVMRAAAVDDRMHNFTRREDGMVTIRVPETAARDRSLRIEIFQLAPPGPRDDRGLQTAFANNTLPRQPLAMITGAMLRQHPDWTKVEPPATRASGCLPVVLIAAVLSALVLIAAPVVRWVTGRGRRPEQDG